MSAYLRAAILLALAIAAIVATVMFLTRERANTPAQAAETGSGFSGFLQPAPLDPPKPMRALFEVDLRQRLNGLAPAFEPQPSLLLDSQIVSYYGNPYTPEMGILGSASLESVADQLQRRAETYDSLNGPTRVIPAIHLVYGVAQYHPTDNGLYLQYVDDATVQRYIELTAERGMLLFIDLQIGHSTVEDELPKVAEYLAYPHVHLALDPEFAMRGEDIPGQELGSIDGADIDLAQDALQRIVVEHRLPPKLLIVHQFVDSMVLDGDTIQAYDNVELIIDMDGFGPAEVKRVKYQDIAGRSYAAFAAIKLFFDHDPDLMSEQDVLALDPSPAVVIYQ